MFFLEVGTPIALYLMISFIPCAIAHLAPTVRDRRAPTVRDRRSLFFYIELYRTAIEKFVCRDDM